MSLICLTAYMISNTTGSTFEYVSKCHLVMTVTIFVVLVILSVTVSCILCRTYTGTKYSIQIYFEPNGCSTELWFFIWYFTI